MYELSGQFFVTEWQYGLTVSIGQTQISLDKKKDNQTKRLLM